MLDGAQMQGLIFVEIGASAGAGDPVGRLPGRLFFLGNDIINEGVDNTVDNGYDRHSGICMETVDWCFVYCTAVDCLSEKIKEKE